MSQEAIAMFKIPITLTLAMANISLSDQISRIDLGACSYQAPCDGVNENKNVSYSAIGQGNVSFKTTLKWTLSVRVDRLTDQMSCILQTDRSRRDLKYPEFNKDVPELFASLNFVTPAFSIYHYKVETYPGTDEVFRVDKNPALYKSENGSLSNSASRMLVQQMKLGKTLLIAHERWPERWREFSEIDLDGFTEIYNASVMICRRYGSL